VKFGPAEYFSLMVLGLSILTYLSHGSLLKAMVMACFGLVLGLIGLDSISAVARLTFDRMELVDGVGLVPIVMGLFGIAEILVNIEQKLTRETVAERISGLLPTRQDWSDSAAPLARGSVLGFLLGILPGGGAVIASFLSYAVEKRVSKTPERFGKGAIEGVAGPEAANNAAAGSGFIPLLTLGIPPNVVMALLLGAFIVHNVQPGPLLMVQNPGLFWGIVASMYIGNLMLLILNLPLIGIWVQVLRVPYRILFPLILLFCIIGVFSVSNSIFDIYVMIVFGVLGYLMRKLGYEPAPLILAFVLGPMMENNLRKSLILSDGSFWIFLERPISLVCLVLAAVLLTSALLPMWRARRERIALESAN
jgi:putative tricarboxylic transport membrane protein